MQRLETTKSQIDEAGEQIRLLRFREISGIARIDDCRSERTGIPEAILTEGKSSDDLVEIAEASLTSDARILITRVSDDQLRVLRSRIDAKFMEWNERGRTLVCRCGTTPPKKTGGGVGIITAGTADIPVAEEVGCDVDLIYDAGAAGIHRLFPDLGNLIEKGVDAIVVAAGRDGTLPTVVSGLVPVPVIGLPVSVGYGAGGKGEAALLSMLQSCSVLAVVNIDAGFVAGAFAARIANLTAAARRRGEWVDLV